MILNNVYLRFYHCQILFLSINFKIQTFEHCPCGMLVSLTYGTNISHIRGNGTLVLIHSGIVNGYQLLCDAHAVLEPHLFTPYRPFQLFLFMCLSLWQS